MTNTKLHKPPQIRAISRIFERGGTGAVCVFLFHILNILFARGWGAAALSLVGDCFYLYK